MRTLRNNGLTLVLLFVFGTTLLGQAWAGWAVYNDEQQVHHLPEISFLPYFATSHFWQAFAENGESEFLQMSAFIVLTVFLYQKGSPESNDPDQLPQPARPVDRGNPRVPWPVRRGGFWLRLYSHSLSIFFLVIFLGFFTLHAYSGHRAEMRRRILDGQPACTLLQFVGSGQFWFESMQNWQSEFLSLAAMVYTSVYLRERNSAESKRVEAAHDEHE